MFTPSQEVALGEVLSQFVRDRSREIADPELTDYQQRLGDRLARHFLFSNASVTAVVRGRA